MSHSGIGAPRLTDTGGRALRDADYESASRRRWTIAFVAWLALCWGHSLMSGDMSSFESSRFVFLVRPFFELVGITSEKTMTFFVRKGAHFTEYAILAALLRSLAHAWLGRGRRAVAAMLLGVTLIPLADEFIQTFVPGRSGQFRDVLIDISGAVTGLIVATVVSRLRDRRGARSGE